MKSVKVFPDTPDRLKRSPAVGWALREVAKSVSRRVRAPSDQQVSTRAGVGPRGAFAQIIMSGPRAVFIEFGTRTQAALAPLRSALRSGRGGR